MALSVTAEQFAELLHSDAVVAIEEDGLNKISTAQGIPVMNGTNVRSTYTGQGIAIAIIDTGIDYTHPYLGGGGFPNGKVIGGYDTGEDDGDPMDGHGHGTACAGIAAGSVSSGSDYIGGVAPDAKLYALKITFSSTGAYAFDSDIIEAWEWCVTHQYDNANYPIMIVSTSFGGGKFVGNCDDTNTALAAAADALNAAGIALFVSAGNAGYCDAVEKPACLTNSIAVGAVYDAGVGNYSFCVSEDSCQEAGGYASCDTGYKSVLQTTAARLVTAYSNSGTMLDLFAPSHNAYTLSTGGGYISSFGGTSASAPYAAGAGLLIQQAAKAATGSFLTPAALKSVMVSTGLAVTDAKAAVTRPLIDLQTAVESIGGYAPTPDPPPPPSPGPSPSPPPAPVNHTARLFFHNEDSGKVAFWNVQSSGKLENSEQGTGWGYVSENLLLAGNWRMSGLLDLNGTKTLYWQNRASGEVLFWKTAADGSLLNETEGDGWGLVADSLRVPEEWKAVGFETIGGQATIIWQNQSQGQVAYWRIDGGGRLKNTTEGDGWGLVSDTLLVKSAWSLVDILEVGGQKTLIWQNQSNGKVVYWRLTDGAVLKNRTQGDGWDYVSDNIVVKRAWRLAGGENVGGQQTLVWQNASNGRVVYWRLNDGARLLNETRGEGWDLVSEEIIVPSDWRLAGVVPLGTGSSLIWQNRDKGGNVYWHLSDGARLRNRTRDDGWGFISDELRLRSVWRLGAIASY